MGGRLTTITRKTDTVSRMGGDEFVMLLTEVNREEDATDVAQRVVEAIREPLRRNGHELSVTTSIGIALYPDDGGDLEMLLKHADSAMYQVKQRGRNGYLRYVPSMNSATRD